MAKVLHIFLHCPITMSYNSTATSHVHTCMYMWMLKRLRLRYSCIPQPSPSMILHPTTMKDNFDKF